MSDQDTGQECDETPDGAAPGEPGNAALRWRTLPRSISAGIFICSCLWAAYCHCVVAVLPYDDAYITYRYVDNLVEGRGLVYNEGERIMGSTTPLYVLWLALLKLVLPSASLPALAVRGNLIPFVLTGLGAWLLLSRCTGNGIVSALGAAALMVNFKMLRISTGGMESCAFTALLLFGLYCLAVGRPVAFGLLAGACILTRPEGVLLIPLAAIVFLRSSKNAVRAACAALAVLLPWLVFSSLYFGSPVPHSVLAKSKPLYPLLPGDALRRSMRNLEAMLTVGSMPSLHQFRTTLVIDLIAVASAAALIVPAFRKRGAWLPAATFWLMMLMYYAGNPLIFPWYMGHVYVCVFLALLTGVWAVHLEVKRRFHANGRQSASRGAILMPTFFALVWLILFTSLAPYTARAHAGSPTEELRDSPMYLRTVAYKQTAELLNEVCQPGQKVATPEIGALGFYFGGRVLDACGLVSPEALPHLPVPLNQRYDRDCGAISVDFVRSVDPEWVVTLSYFAKQSLLASPWFAQEYSEFKRIALPEACWKSKEVLVFARKDVFSATPRKMLPGG